MWTFKNVSLFLIQITLFLCVLNVVPSSLESNCTNLRDAFANFTSEFISCAIQNSRPITLCNNCVSSYIDVINSYKNMTQLLDNGTYCINEYINLDRLQIVQTLYSNSYNLWNNAKCYECFETVNGSLTKNQSTETQTFYKYYKTYHDCTIDKISTNDSLICTICMDEYFDLDNYYTSISNENEAIGVCMDIVDLMNTTRTFWSLKCCKYRRHPEIIFIASTVCVLIFTLLFYIVAQICSVRKTPTILQQTRLAETLSQFTHSQE